MKRLWARLTRILRRRVRLVQHIAVFGESGCGKTTLLTCFYGHQQAAHFRATAGYALRAQNATESQKLLQAYHRIADDLLPPQTRFRQQQFTFDIQPHGIRKNAGTLVWYDYPGEWWSETRDGEEGQLKDTTFASLLSSDVALFLIDGQRLLDEEHYIPRLLKTFRDEVSRHGDKFRATNTLLTSYPRNWTICLSKADLFPDKDVEWFRSEVIKQAAEELDAIREEIKSFILKPEFLSFGEDYLLLSAAQFDPTSRQIVDPHRMVGIDLLTPLAITTPIRYARQWLKAERTTKKGFAGLANASRGLTTNWMKWIPIVGRGFQLLDEVAKGGVTRLERIHQAAVAKGDEVDAVLASLEIRLRDPNNKQVYCRERD